MGYFSRELTKGSWKFWIFVLYLSSFIVGLVDMLSWAFGGGGIAGGKIFRFVMIFHPTTLLAAGAFYAVRDQKRKKKLHAREEFRGLNEPELEREIRRLISEMPDFRTHCYQCHFFDHATSACKRNLNEDFEKSIRINNIRYCLYWAAENGQSSEPGRGG